jgi:hypothetical protein
LPHAAHTVESCLRPIEWGFEGIGYLLGIHVYYKPESPCYWTWDRLMQMTDEIWRTDNEL